MTQEVEKRFRKEIPELRGELSVTNKKYIIFGAGKYGTRAANLLGSRAVFFADSDQTKAGKIKCGLRILNFYDAVRLAENYCFLIAVSNDRIYEMISQLTDMGVEEYCVFYNN